MMLFVLLFLSSRKTGQQPVKKKSRENSPTRMEVDSVNLNQMNLGGATRRGRKPGTPNKPAQTAAAKDNCTF